MRAAAGFCAAPVGAVRLTIGLAVFIVAALLFVLFGPDAVMWAVILVGAELNGDRAGGRATGPATA